MSTLTDYQFEILPDADAVDGFVFGIGAGVSLNDGGFDPGESGWITQDQQNTRRGVTAFGRDVLGSKTWVFESHTNQDDAASAIDILEQFSTAWSPIDLVMQPGKQTALRYHLAGRDRRVYGRPRRFAAPPTNLILNGFVPITHDFQLVDAFTYDDEESSVLIPYATTSTGGGFVPPAVLPISLLSSDGNGSGQLEVGGSARAYPIVRFNGPWTNPVMITDDWQIAWKGSIPDNDWIEIDCRPWNLYMKNKAGASVVGGLDVRRTYLEDLWFAPNSRPQVILDGSAPGGNASAYIRWRNTWTSI